MVKRYLQVISLDDALALLSREFSCHPIDRDRFRWRKLPDGLQQDRSLPATRYRRSTSAAMDGIAVVSADTRDASEQHPVTLARAARVNTGNVVPPEFDAVIMIEDVWETDGRYTIRKSARPGSTSARPGRTLPSPRW